ncbi:hypothetical protein HY441_02080 [Candidatus Microgenomates bacterium]|nr:hypothetical protein [Candidatus Microgenomates bacterium]
MLDIVAILNIPTSVWGWFVGFIAVSLLAIRSFRRYLVLKTPLQFYYVLTGLTFGLALGCYSVPFMLSDRESILKTAFIVGDAFIYLALIVQTRILWYLGLHKLMRYGFLLIPVVLLSLISWGVSTVYTISTSVSIVSNVVVYSLPAITLYLQAGLFLVMLAVGYFFIREAISMISVKQKLKSLTLGTTYVLVGIAVIINNIFFQGLNNTALVNLLYLTVFGIFLLSLVVLNIRLRRQPQQPKSP